MKIPSGNEVANYVNRSNISELKKHDESTGVNKEGLQEQKEGAVVDLSQKSKDVHKIQKTIQNEPDVRMEKVKAIKERIENGEYDIDYDKTAEKILDSFLDDLA